MKSLALIFVCGLLCAVSLYAETTEEAKALDETLSILVSPEQRKQILDKDPKAKEADDFALQVGGNAANQQKIYELAAKVMADLAKSGNSDPDKMMQILEKANKNPEAFANTFSPEQKKMLQELAAEIEKSKSSKPIH
jgi:uncharacterized alpha-E superfamily protein